MRNYLKQRHLSSTIKKFLSTSSQSSKSNNIEHISDRLSNKLWEFNLKKRFDKTISLYDQYYQSCPSKKECNANNMDDLYTSKSIYAVMLAYSEIFQPWKLKELAEKLQTEQFSQLSLCLIMYSYAKTDKLGSAERLIQAWIKSCINNTNGNLNHHSYSHIKLVYEKFSNSNDIHPSDGELAKSKEMKSFLDNLSSFHQLQQLQNISESTKKKKGEGDIPLLCYQPPIIPLGAWISLLSIYSKRRAWKQCIHVLKHLHEMAEVNPSYYGIIKSTPLESSKMKQFPNDNNSQSSNEELIQSQLRNQLDELDYPTFVNVHKDILSSSTLLNHDQGFTSTLTSSMSTIKYNTIKDFDELQYHRLLQWNIIYQLTFRALCDANQFELCLSTMAQMKSYTIPRTTTTTTNSPTHSTSPSSLHTISNRSSIDTIAERGDISLTPQINAITSLLQGFIASNPGTNYIIDADKIALNQKIVLSFLPNILEAFSEFAITQYSGCGRKLTLNHLVREYLQVLCKLGLSDAAESFVQSIEAHLMEIKQRTGLLHISGFQNNNWMYPLILHYKAKGNWKKLHTLYTTSIQSQFNDDDGVLFIDENENSNHDNGDDSIDRKSIAIDRYNRNKEKEAVKYSSPTINMYHQTCAGLRNAGQLERLADLMETYSPDKGK